MTKRAFIPYFASIFLFWQRSTCVCPIPILGYYAWITTAVRRWAPIGRGAWADISSRRTETRSWTWPTDADLRWVWHFSYVSFTLSHVIIVSTCVRPQPWWGVGTPTANWYWVPVGAAATDRNRNWIRSGWWTWSGTTKYKLVIS